MTAEIETPASTHPRRRRPRRPTQPVSRGLLVSAGLWVAFALLTWYVAGPLEGYRVDQTFNRDYPIDGFIGSLHLLDRIGQRAVCLPILAVVVAALAWRHRSARPVLTAVVVVLGVNLAVLILKIWLGRGAPLGHRPGFMIDGQMYPSGHAANIVVVYGLAVYLISHYGLVSRWVRRAMIGGVGVLMVIMTMTSLLLRWHWLTDLLAGFLVGGALLAATIGIDAAVPFRSRRLIVVPEEQMAEATPPTEKTAPG